MKRVNFVLICIFLMSLACSCKLEPEKEEKIQVINRTDEDVEIYYHGYLGSEYRLTTIVSGDTKFIYVTPGTTYYARGEISKREYGEGKFVKVPSKYDPRQTWEIK